ncbi:ribosome recycling factor [Armillaria novae-zelandiae]|uniref:Ribosome recycling factor n=1 Tax=Armillaria novae-zelandiae TaxID=153914 RepID=A0AA39PWJ5_9AGAR|nr:ribosome recycling factor [Armillaria novae-zelandiae]
MQTLLRSRLSFLVVRAAKPSLRSLITRTPLPQRRTYAKKAQSTSTLQPGSQQPLTKATDIAEHDKCQEKMKNHDCADAAARASGRVTPALLANVRVQGQKLEQVATVGVRDGSMLVVTVFEEDNLKHVEAAIYDAKIPSITPQRQDTRTLRIPVPKPTLDAKSSVVTAAGKKAEEARVQCRKLHQTSVKKGKYEKRSVELEVFQDLLDKYVSEIDKILVDMKKMLGVLR